MAGITNREPDFEQFLKILWRKGMPNRLPFYEHVSHPGFIAKRMGVPFDKMGGGDPLYWPTYVNFWLGMGYDCIPMEIPLNCPVAEGHHGTTEGSEALAVISNREDFDKYPWPDVATPIDFGHFETVSRLLPDGCKIVGGVCAGPYEWVSRMMGTIGLSYAMADDPELVALMFAKIGSLHHSAVRQLASMDFIGALRQGDDLGFKTSTFLAPDKLREWVFPIYKKMVSEAHEVGKPFILHSCGNLADVYEDLIEGCKIDAKHSFEDVIMPVAEFKKQYGARVTPIGGLDVDMICRGTPDELRRYTRKAIEECFSDGYWALGTGNSLTDYMPVENYLTVLEVGMEVAG